MSSRRALRSTVPADDLNSPLKSEPRKRSSRKKTPAVTDALAPSVEAALEGQTPPSIQSDAESEIQATAESRSTSPPTTSQPMRRRLRSASRELSPPNSQPTTLPKVASSRKPRATSATKQRAAQNSTRGGSRGRGRAKKATPAPRNKKRTADESVTDQSADDADNDNDSRPSKRARSEQYSADEDHTSVASTEADEHDSSIYHTPQAERAPLPFSPIPELEEPEETTGAVGSTSRSNTEQQFVAESSSESIVMQAREGSLEIIEHTQVEVSQPSMEVMESTETNEDAAHDAADLEMSDAESPSDDSDPADSPSAQLIPNSAESEQDVDTSEEESNDASVSDVNTTMVAGPSASAANDQTTSPSVGSVAKAQPTFTSPNPNTPSSFLSKFNIFRSSQKTAHPEGSASPEPEIHFAPKTATPTPQQPTPTPTRAPTTVRSMSRFASNMHLEQRGIHPLMFNRRLQTYNPSKPSQEVQIEAEEDGEEEFSIMYEKYHEQEKKNPTPRLGSNSTITLLRSKLEADKKLQEMEKKLKEAEPYKPKFTQLQQKRLRKIGKQLEIELQQTGSVSETNDIELLAEETDPASNSRDTTTAVPAIDTAASPPPNLTSDSTADVPAMNSAVNSHEGGQEVDTETSLINSSFVDEDMEVDDAVDMAADVAEPLTPTPATEPVKKSFWSAATGSLKNLVTSPFVFMGRQGQTAANAALTNNNEADTPRFTYEHPHQMSDTPTRPARNQRRMRPADQPQQQRPGFRTKPEPKRVAKSHSPSKSAHTSRLRRENENRETSITPAEAEKQRLAKFREKLDNMTPAEKVAHEQKTIEIAKVWSERRAKNEAALAGSESSKKRGAPSIFDGDDEFGEQSPFRSRGPLKKRKVEESGRTYGVPSVEEENAFYAGQDAQEAAAKSLAKGKSPMGHMSATPLSSGESPMSIDSPPTILDQDVPAELQHPLNRAPDALYYRQIELIQARMNDEERKHDNDFRVGDYSLWKFAHGVSGPLTEGEDMEAWETELRNARKRWGGSGDSEEGLMLRKNGFLMSRKAEREELQLTDIERRKKELFAADPNNVFLKARLQEEQSAADAEPFVPSPAGRSFGVPADFDDMFDDDEEEDSDDAAQESQQSVNDEAVNTPPPPPRPSNAQLPQQPTGVVIGMESYVKNLPANPSKLRHVEEMSPLQIEKARRESEGVQNKENKAPGPMEMNFHTWAEQYMKDGQVVPGSWREELDYGQEDIVADLTDAYAEYDRMQL